MLTSSFATGNPNADNGIIEEIHPAVYNEDNGSQYTVLEEDCCTQCINIF